jgi:hypothetical protein
VFLGSIANSLSSLPCPAYNDSHFPRLGGPSPSTSAWHPPPQQPPTYVPSASPSQMDLGSLTIPYSHNAVSLRALSAGPSQDLYPVLSSTPSSASTASTAPSSYSLLGSPSLGLYDTSYGSNHSSPLVPPTLLPDPVVPLSRISSTSTLGTGSLSLSSSAGDPQSDNGLRVVATPAVRDAAEARRHREGRFQCIVPGCGANFTTRHNLRGEFGVPVCCA